MFCPKCGTQNPDTAQTCTNCKSQLAAPKFKGTMLMVNPGSVPGMPAAGVAGAPAGAAPTPPLSPAAPQAPAAASRSAPPGAASVPSKLKGTMVGVAPPMGGGAPSPVAVPPAAGFGAPPPAAASPYGGPPAPAPAAYGAAPQPGPAPSPGFGPPPAGPAAGYGAPHPAPAFGEQPAAYSPPVPQQGVNPLGGTMAADAGSFAAFGAAVQAASSSGPGASPYGPPPGAPPEGGFGAPPAYGAPPGGYGPPAGAPPGGPSPYGAPPPGAYGAPPPAYDAYGQQQQSPYGQPAPQQQGYGQGAPQQQQGLAPYGQAGMAAVAGTLQSVGAPTKGPTRRSAVTALLPLAIIVGGDIVGGILAGILFMISPALAGIVRLLTSLVGLGGLVLLVLLTIQMVSELKSVTRNQAFAWWPMLVPFYNLYWVLVLLPQEVTKAKQILGVQAPTRNLVLYFFLYPYALASDLNDMVR